MSFTIKDLEGLTKYDELLLDYNVKKGRDDRILMYKVSVVKDENTYYTALYAKEPYQPYAAQRDYYEGSKESTYRWISNTWGDSGDELTDEYGDELSWEHAINVSVGERDGSGLDDEYENLSKRKNKRNKVVNNVKIKLNSGDKKMSFTIKDLEDLTKYEELYLKYFVKKGKDDRILMYNLYVVKDENTYSTTLELQEPYRPYSAHKGHHEGSKESTYRWISNTWGDSGDELTDEYGDELSWEHAINVSIGERDLDDEDENLSKRKKSNLSKRNKVMNTKIKLNSIRRRLNSIRRI